MRRPVFRVPAEALLSVAVGLLAFGLRLRGIGHSPLWLDELITLNRASLPFLGVFADSFANTHFPTFFLLAKPFAGLGPVGLRLPSALFSAAVAAMAVLIGRRLGGGWAGAAAGLLVALSPFQVLYGQEARAYALLTLAVTVALYGLLRLVQATDPARDRAGWALWTAGTALAVCTMPLGAPWLLVSLIVLAMLLAARPAEERGALLRRGGVALGLVLACWLPLLAGVFGSLEHAASNGTWISPADARDLRTAFFSVFLFRLSDPVSLQEVPTGLKYLGVIIPPAAAYGAWVLRRRPLVVTVLGLGALGLPLALLAASTVTPVFIPRYLIWAAVPFLALAGAGLGAVAERARPAVPVLLLLLGLWNLEPYYRAELKPDWAGALRIAWAAAAPGDAVYLRGATDHYAAHVLEMRAEAWEEPLIRLGTPQEANAWLSAGGRLWIIDVHSAKRPSTTPALARGLTVPERIDQTRPFGRRVTLYRLAPQTPG